ncbi:MAG: transposase [Treponema sp.]|nr:transposase [Treponema sp.]
MMRDITKFFNYTEEILRTIYTTNAIASLNFSLQKGIKNRLSFPDATRYTR